MSNNTTEVIQDLLETLESTRNFITGVTFDPTIPEGAKIALKSKAEEIEQKLEEYADYE